MVREGAGPLAKILVVDDVPENVELLEAYLLEVGYQVIKAYDGEKALRQIEKEDPDIVLLDIMMPKLNGYEVCHKLKADERTVFIPVIMITALKEPEERIRAIEVGADDFLTKPFNKQELLARVRSLLRVKSLHNQVEAYNRLLEQKVAERTVQLERALEELRELDRMKTNFVSNISHELLTPLTPIKGYLGILLEETLGPLSPAQQKGLAAIRESVERLHQLINDLLAYMRMESGRLKLNRRQILIHEILKQAWEKAFPLAQAKSQTFTLSVPPNLPPVSADPEELLRALSHLIENAVKFTPEGGTVHITARPVKCQASIVHRAEDTRLRGDESRVTEEGFVEIAVTDTGIGIPEDKVERIFDRFYQVDDSATREQGGMGIGLAIVKQILEAHGSRIEVDSQVGRGSTFRFFLPSTVSR